MTQSIQRPCEFPGCGNPKVPGHGSKYCQEHRDGANERKLARLREKNRKPDCQMEGCEEPKLLGHGHRYCTKHSGESLKRQRLRMKARSRERQYGITHAEYLALLEAQGGVCAICGNGPSKTRTLHVDHDHVTGTVRGLLCTRCNPMLGYAHDDVAVLQAAIAYLTRPPRPASA